MSEGIIVTFDLDSTVADTEQRFGLINREGTTDWHAYSAACVDDEPIEGMVALIKLLVSGGVECHALSGRKASALEATKQWFTRHDIPISQFWLDESDVGDYETWTQHVNYKLGQVHRIERETGKKVVLHLDDWPGVVVGFENSGIPAICVRAPFEIREAMAEKISMDALK